MMYSQDTLPSLLLLEIYQACVHKICKYVCVEKTSLSCRLENTSLVSVLKSTCYPIYFDNKSKVLNQQKS